jgi:hypothetical protein
MNGAGDELLASASLTEDQHAGVRRTHAAHVLEHPQEPGTGADDFVEVVSRLDFLLQITVPAFDFLQPSLRVHALQLAGGPCGDDLAQQALVLRYLQCIGGEQAKMTENRPVGTAEWHAEIALVVRRGQWEPLGEAGFVVHSLALEHRRARRAIEIIFVVRRRGAMRDHRQRAHPLRVNDVADQRFGGVEGLAEALRQQQEQLIAASARSRREMV